MAESDIVHITELVPGDQVRIGITVRQQLIVKITKNGLSLVPGRPGGRMTRAKTKTNVFGTISSNTPEIGQMILNAVYDRNTTMPAIIPYSFIKIIQKIIPFKENVETGNRPGEIALGTKLPGATLLTPRFNLVPVKF